MDDSCGFEDICKNRKLYGLGEILWGMYNIYTKLKPKEWDRINHAIHGTDVKHKRYSHISVNVNLGQEILDERSILCVLTSQLYDKYRSYILSPIANVEMWSLYVGAIIICVICYPYAQNIWGTLDGRSVIFLFLRQMIFPCIYLLLSVLFLIIVAWHQIRTLSSLHILSKRIDAHLAQESGMEFQYRNATLGTKMGYHYPIANTRNIESQLIAILDRIDQFPIHPTFYFVFDELDKIETPLQQSSNLPPEFSNEKYLSTGGTSRKRKFTVMHLLANMKFFTSTAKAKFLFIAGREMYDGYLADLTDRESAMSSLFNGVIYVESFCKNEKSERDVMYNAETFISRQLIPHEFVESRVIDKYVECKLNGTIYMNIDINLKMYYEYLVQVYADCILGNVGTELTDVQKRGMDDARACIDKAIGLLYHYSVYLYHISNGSPKKMGLTFENLVRPIRDRREFILSTEESSEHLLISHDIDIHIPHECRYLLSFGEKEQRVVGFIHYISFPVNQIISASEQYGDKLLVSASFLINHLYKYHNGGFSWRNIEQIPELLEVYKIPEFRDYINSILSYLLQTHIIPIPCGLYQFKFRKQISEEISLASKISEEVSSLFNFTLDESQSVKRHYRELQKNHLYLLKREGIASPHSVAGIHHILGDMYMEDEEYNNAIFEYQTALRVLGKMDMADSAKANGDPHRATFMLAYIRNMLKLGMAFEKRRTYASAYNTYNEIISKLFLFREFDEKKFGLKYVANLKDTWPYEDAILYISNEKEPHDREEIEKIVYDIEENDRANIAYQTKGRWMIMDFAYQMTPAKHTVIQRLAMLEDTRIVYQALLAKLFVNEKVELGGITRTNLDLIEGEFQYIHLTTNEKQKFLISTDFFRRLGDIMFYKNGLIGFDKTLDYGKSGKGDCFVEGLYYWAFDIHRELNNFCNKNKCYELYEKLLKESRLLKINDFKELVQKGEKVIIPSQEKEGRVQKAFSEFWRQPIVLGRIKKLPLDEISLCNKRRAEMWKHNKTMPCYACKYYNRSLRIIMRNLFGVDIENVTNGEKAQSKTIRILEMIVVGGTAKSVRQNYLIQLGEVLDCMGNTILSCSSLDKETESNERLEITSKFLALFLHDAHEINDNLDFEKVKEDFGLLNNSGITFSKLEISILYFWEASICFRYGRELKKASGSMKKILRVIQNYMRVAEQTASKGHLALCKICIGEFLNEIKNRLVKQSLICLYSHYNFINLIEIQRLKWIFYVQMYENISLNRLSLFPDVEEIMLIYYELIRLCVVEPYNKKEHDKYMQKVRTDVNAYSRTMSLLDRGNASKAKKRDVDYTWDNIRERNADFNTRLAGIYNNISMGSLRHENTVYERILSLRAKTRLNRHILEMAFPVLKAIPVTETNAYAYAFCKILTTGEYEGDGYDETWKKFFPDMTFCEDVESTAEKIAEKLHFLEFLIRDSIYCLTAILGTITPYKSTTLFTNSFLGNIYQSLNRWNVMFDALYRYYRVFDEENDDDCMCQFVDEQREKRFALYDNHLCDQCLHPCIDEKIRYWEQANRKKDSNSDIQMMWQSKCPHYNKYQCTVKKNDYERDRETVLTYIQNRDNYIRVRDIYRKAFDCLNLSDRFFESVLQTINKPNIHYTLTNYSGEMALKSYRNAKELHREGKTYKDMISKMYYLDDDLKNDTIQFDLAIERFKINSGLIDKNIKDVMKFSTNSIYDVEGFCTDNEARLPLKKRFPDMFWNSCVG